ncbi:MAG TPA: hypothetical protein PL155_06225 [Candidatus Omnitrophota bacterium]|nr:hypothetical protein [Candidatus Omnitrophota bacterium]HPD83925.1 hypothetical protein [Candidatus Omnitrophota bacterium]HRZ02782.1 hypothetical protein [Candidatus Omnitrophota bacterium]
MKRVRIKCSPFTSNLEVDDDLVLKLHVPYSDKEVTIQINPNIQDYKEKNDNPGAKIRQTIVTTPTDETRTLKFDFNNMRAQKIVVGETAYKIELLEIGKEEAEGQRFPYFDFSVSRE